MVYQVNAVTPRTISRIEEEGSHFHPTSREQFVPVSLDYQPYGRPLQQADAGSKELSLAGPGFDGFLGTTVVDEDVKRNFEARTGIEDIGGALNAVFFNEVVTLFTGHGLVAFGNGTEAVSAKQIIGASINNTLPKGTPIKFVDGKFEEATAGNTSWGEYIEEVETDIFRFKIYQVPVIVP